MKPGNIKKLKSNISFTKDTSSLRNFIEANHLSESQHFKLVNAIGDYMDTSFVFTVDDKFYCLKPPFDFFKFNSFNEMAEYLKNKKETYNKNMSLIDFSKENAERIFEIFEESVHMRSNFEGVSIMNYMVTYYKKKTVFCDQHSLADNFFETSERLQKRQIHGEIQSAFSYKGFDFTFEKDYEKIYFRCLIDRNVEGRGYENHRVLKSGILFELLELFYDSHPEILEAVYHTYHRSEH